MTIIFTECTQINVVKFRIMFLGFKSNVNHPITEDLFIFVYCLSVYYFNYKVDNFKLALKKIWRDTFSGTLFSGEKAIQYFCLKSVVNESF